MILTVYFYLFRRTFIESLIESTKNGTSEKDLDLKCNLIKFTIPLLLKLLSIYYFRNPMNENRNPPETHIEKQEIIINNKA